MRLDLWLTAQRLLPSRARAQAAIKAGHVTVNGNVVTKTSFPVGPDDVVAVSGDPIGYVGRGGLKLAAALDHFGVSPDGRDCLDVGASTGGFTDCLLRRGACRVAAVDVGQGQLHPQLVNDSRVWALSETDVRDLTPGRIEAAWGTLPDLATIDVSFISLKLVLPAVTPLLAPDADVLALVKPQFEVGRGAVGKGGIVRDEASRERAVTDVAAAATALGLRTSPAFASPVTGTDGNQEYFLLLRKSGRGRG